MTLSMLHSGCSAGSGSGWTTSSAAPAMDPERSASTRASVSNQFPAPHVNKMCCGFHGGKDIGVHQAPGVVCQRCGQHNVVEVADNQGQIPGGMDLFKILIPGSAAAPGTADLQAHGTEQGRDFPADGPRPDHQGTLALNLPGDAVLPAPALLEPERTLAHPSRCPGQTPARTRQSPGSGRHASSCTQRRC